MDALDTTLATLCDRAGPAPVLVVDALLGIGQTRNADAILAPFRQAVASLSGPHGKLRHVAVDVPTGYDSDTGKALTTQPFPADLVVTFHAGKPVHGVLERQGLRSVVVPIGL
jgi:NAD(P)H-hydrate repair Nnr-like enzyme with NAD(P)H-hydrate epimerase domain